MLQEDYEEFTNNQLSTLEKFVTNTRGHIFALKNLPEVIKGALFSKYSRSARGLRPLLLEFITNEDESAFTSIVGADTSPENNHIQTQAIKKAQHFYDRILDGYGDDSIGELGGAHLAIENISMIAAKQIEDCRIGGSPLEKSTRYIYFDQKVKGEYLFYREPILMTSAYRDLYLATCNSLFETYSTLIPLLTQLLEKKAPKDPETSNAAYRASLRAKVLDCLRGLLPAGTMTNMGLFGNGRFFECLIHKLHCHNLQELQNIGKTSFEELSRIIPSFIRRADLSHHTHQKYAGFTAAMEDELRLVAAHYADFPEKTPQYGANLISYDPEGPAKIAASFLFSRSNKSLASLLQHVKTLPEDALIRILESGCSHRENRRHKSPRGLEHATFTFEMLTDFGVYRDLHRHRLLTQERQLLTCDYGYYTPPEIKDTPLESTYHTAMQQAKSAYDTISQEFPEEAQYVVPMASNIRWYFHLNLRSLQWLCELRSQPAGHPEYRYIAQEMAKQVCQTFPCLEMFLKFVDYDGYDLGRLGQEQRQTEKQLQL